VELESGQNPDADLQDWIRRVKAGDQDAAAELVRHYEPEIRRFIRVRLTDPRLRRLLDSVDICQSVLARFFLHVQTERLTVEHPLQLLKLLTTMARNSLCDHARKARVRQAVTGTADPAVVEAVADSRASVADRTEQADLVACLRRQMSPADQSVVDRWVLGEGWDVLSRDFACEPDALRKRMTRAIDRAARELGLLRHDDA